MNASGAPELAAAQDRWLEAELALAASEGARRVVVFSHIPPFINEPDEGSGYFPLPRDVRHRLLTQMARYGVSHWFCGHYHRNAGGVFCLPCDEDTVDDDADQRSQTLEVVITAAVGANIGLDPLGDPLGQSGMLDVAAEPNLSGLRIVEVGERTLTHRFVTLDAIGD